MKLTQCPQRRTQILGAIRHAMKKNDRFFLYENKRSVRIGHI